MNELAKRWLIFAEDDLKMAKLALAEGIYNQVCFHAQQCAEKSLKVLSAEQGEVPPKTHKLIDLLLSIRNPQIAALRRVLQLLDRFYMTTRYPDALPGTLLEGLPTEADAQSALQTAQQVIEVVRDALQ